MKDSGVFGAISKHLTMRDLLPLQLLNKQTYKKMVPAVMKKKRNGYEIIDNIGHFVIKDIETSDG